MVALKQPFSNMQLELIKLYATGVPDEYLPEIKEMIARFLFNKAREEADKAWDEKGYNENTLNQWLNKA